MATEYELQNAVEDAIARFAEMQRPNPHFYSAQETLQIVLDVSDAVIQYAHADTTKKIKGDLQVIPRFREIALQTIAIAWDATDRRLSADQRARYKNSSALLMQWHPELPNVL